MVRAFNMIMNMAFNRRNALIVPKLQWKLEVLYELSVEHEEPLDN